MRSPFCMLLTFALTLALSLPGRAQTPTEGSCVNVSVEVNVSVNLALNVDGGVNLAWATGPEPDTAGFNIYRLDPGGSYYKLNDALIPAQPDPVSGGCSYTFPDWPGNGTSPYYMLESIGIDGKRKHRALVSTSNPY